MQEPKPIFVQDRYDGYFKSRRFGTQQKNPPMMAPDSTMNPLYGYPIFSDDRREKKAKRLANSVYNMFEVPKDVNIFDSPHQPPKDNVENLMKLLISQKFANDMGLDLKTVSQQIGTDPKLIQQLILSGNTDQANRLQMRNILQTNRAALANKIAQQMGGLVNSHGISQQGAAEVARIHLKKRADTNQLKNEKIKKVVDEHKNKHQSTVKARKDILIPQVGAAIISNWSFVKHRLSQDLNTIGKQRMLSHLMKEQFGLEFSPTSELIKNMVKYVNENTVPNERKINEILAESRGKINRAVQSSPSESKIDDPGSGSKETAEEIEIDDVSLAEIAKAKAAAEAKYEE